MTSKISFCPVAVIAADCILPKAPNLESFFLANEQSLGAIEPVPPDWWGEESLYDPDPFAPNKSYTELAALIGEWDLAYGQFKLPPRSLEALDPVHALAMELARRVVEEVEDQAPLPRDNTALVIANIAGGTHTALDLYMRLESQKWAYRAMEMMPEAKRSIIHYEREVLRRHACSPEEMSINSGSGTIGGRISNYFGFRGPHYAVDGACASSMAALHSACIGLHQGAYEAALVGAFSRCLPELHVVNSKARTLSAKGSFPFDERADGFVPGEGGIMVALMPLHAAEQAGHPIQGVIRSIGYSTNGRETAPWAPSLEGEILAVRRALDDFDADSSGIDYVEAHGTSTRRGDAVEFSCLSETYARTPDEPPLPFGSVKSMIGHLIEGAGLAGLLRALFVFERRKLPPTIGSEPRGDLAFEESGLKLQQEVGAVEENGRPLRVGINCFGYGGLNYHVLMEDGEGSSRRSSSTARQSIPSHAANGSACDRVAIVGMGAVLPDAPDIPSFWKNLTEGRASSHDLHRYVPMLDLFLEPDAASPRGTYVQRVAAAEDPLSIDFARFRIMPNRTPNLTKDLLLLLQATSEAIRSLDRGLDGVDLSKAGCIVGQIPDSDGRGKGVASIRYRSWFNGLAQAVAGEVNPERLSEVDTALWEDPDLGLILLNEDASVSGYGSLMASCVASGLGFQGKSFVARAACSTSLAALTLAVQELRQHTLDFVLCGATSAGIELANQVVLTPIQALSRQGQTHPYDSNADGFILGSGAVMTALKRLDDAERDGDRILAVVRDVAGSSDGKGTSLLAPNVTGRELVLKRIYEEGPVPFDTVQYVEGHGAATAMGDETEVEALTATRTGSAPLYLGSVKGNIGHLKAAAGMAGLAKAVLTLQHKTIPPSAGTENPAPSLRLETRGIETPSSPLPWPRPPQGSRRAAVNAFGLGGSNYHLLLEEHVPDVGRSSPPAAAGDEIVMLTWSADSYRLLADCVQDNPSGSNPSGACRAAVVSTQSQLAWLREQLLSRLQEGRGARTRPLPPGVYCNDTRTGVRSTVCFLFPGQGGQYAGMLREIASDDPRIVAAVKTASTALRDEMPDFHQSFWGDGSLPADEIARKWTESTSNAQIATLLTSHVLAGWLADRGIKADLLLGHSIGELAALTAAGAVSFSDSIRIARWRGQLARKARNGQEHAMAAVLGEEKEASKVVGEIPGVYIANLNSPRQIVISGTRAAVERALAAARDRQMEGVVLPIECAYHSPLLADAVAPFRAKLQRIELDVPSSPVYCSAINQLYSEPEAEEIRDALANLYTTKVEFAAMLRDAHSRGARVFVEVGPKRALVDLAGEVLGKDGIEFIPLLHPKNGEKIHLLRASAQLWTLGLARSPLPQEQQTAATVPAPSPTPAECLAVAPEMRPVPPPQCKRTWNGKKVLLVGDGSGLARGLAERLEKTGSAVEAVAVPETLSDRHRLRCGDTVQVESLPERLRTERPPDTIYFLPAFDSCTADDLGDSYEMSLAAGSLAALREVVRAYAGAWEQGAAGELVVVTRLDGRCGHTSSPRGRSVGGALIGFLRSLHHEIESLRTRLLDLPSLCTVESAVEAATEVVECEGRHVERGRFTDDWTESVLVPAYGSPEELLGSSDLPWEAGDTILVTGGACGVTALVARTMMEARTARLQLIGTTTPAAGDDPLLTLTPEQLQEEKIRRFRAARKGQPKLTPVSFERTWSPIVRGLEVARNIELLRSTGAEVEYAQVDLANPRSARAFANRLKRDGRAVEVLVHGAGIEKSRRILDADPDEWDRTFSVKAGGLHHLFPLISPKTKAVLLFGSIAASFGGPGQTDYCAANEYLSRFAYKLSAALPQARVRSIAWPPWEEVGMAATRPSSRHFLESHGIRFMSPEEGGRWALAALGSRSPIPELILLPPDPPIQIHETRVRKLSDPPASSLEPALADAVIPAEEAGSVVRWQFDPESYSHLLEHQIGEKPKLPAAHLLEQMAEAVQAAHPDRHVAHLQNVEIFTPVTLTADRRRDLFVEVVPDEDGLTHRVRMWTHPVLPDGTLVPKRLDVATATVVAAKSAPAEARVDLSPRNLRELSPSALAEEIAKHGIGYGPHFQGICGFAEQPGFSYAAELRPVATATIPGASFLDVPLLDLAMQSLGYVLGDADGGLPTGFDRLDLHCPLTRSPAQAGWALGKPEASERPGVVLTDSEGTVLAEVQGLRIARPEDAQLARI